MEDEERNRMDSTPLTTSFARFLPTLDRGNSVNPVRSHFSPEAKEKRPADFN
jgi:hypothetical protein